MKFSLIAVIVVLALAQGSFAQDSFDIDRLTQYFEEMKNKVVKEVTDLMNNQDLANQAQTFMDDRRTQLEPLVAQIQEHLKSAASTVEEQIQPLAANVQAQIQPQVETFQKQMEAIVKQLTDKAITN
ncbi:type-4 ice-structuring protein LS-12-like [Plectropomus leopardus]|uniref:type-4 ice-structuring protein LS-12-like n=1 Tax=Plectropomus leopardus TaxID=160734 RepID=UPI001C4C4E3B|nr:type-4 ice-structuring protein LS-12-like [Plectropomus leopardus]